MPVTLPNDLEFPNMTCFPKRTLQYIAGLVGAIMICNLYLYISIEICWNIMIHPGMVPVQSRLLAFNPLVKGVPSDVSQIRIVMKGPSYWQPCWPWPGCLHYLDWANWMWWMWNQVFAATDQFSLVYAILISVGSSKQVVVFCHYFAMPCLARLFCGWLAVNKGSSWSWVASFNKFWQLYRISTKTTPLQK